MNNACASVIIKNKKVDHNEYNQNEYNQNDADISLYSNLPLHSKIPHIDFFGGYGMCIHPSSIILPGLHGSFGIDNKLRKQL